MLTARVCNALVAAWAGPTVSTFTSIRFVAKAMLGVAALSALCLIAVVSKPAADAELLACRGAVVVAELIIARPAEGGAAITVVVVRAVDPKKYDRLGI